MLDFYTMKIDKVKIFDHLTSILENKLPFKAPSLVAKGKVVEEWDEYGILCSMF